MSPSRLGSKTVREGWPLTRLLSDVAFVRRTETARIMRRLAIVTMAVQQLEVVVPIGPAVSVGGDVIYFHPIARREEQAACRTFTALALQESCDSGRDLWMVSKACTPIHPIAIIGAPPPLDLHVTPDGRLPVSIEAETSLRGLKDPAVPLGDAPVPMGDPLFAFVGMSVGRPSAQHPIEPVIQTLQETRAADAGVIPRPPNDDRVEQLDQSLLTGMAMALHEGA